MDDQHPQQQPIPSIPDGYASVIGPDEVPCIVPEFLVPATNQVFEGYQKRLNADVDNMRGGPSGPLVAVGTTARVVAVGTTALVVAVGTTAQVVAVGTTAQVVAVGAVPSGPLAPSASIVFAEPCCHLLALLIQAQSGNAAKILVDLVGPHNIPVPANPHMTEREMFGLHAEVEALSQSLGITYKDAAHRLYMAECEKLMADERAHKSFASLSTRTHDSLIHFQTLLRQIPCDETAVQVQAGEKGRPEAGQVVR